MAGYELLPCSCPEKLWGSISGGAQGQALLQLSFLKMSQKATSCTEPAKGCVYVAATDQAWPKGWAKLALSTPSSVVVFVESSHYICVFDKSEWSLLH